MYVIYFCKYKTLIILVTTVKNFSHKLYKALILAYVECLVFVIHLNWVLYGVFEKIGKYNKNFT